VYGDQLKLKKTNLLGEYGVNDTFNI
jgi:hypothetical protein